MRTTAPITQHTPEPWIVEEGASGIFVVAPIRGRGIAGQETIARFPTCGTPDGTTFAVDRARANANLSAQAPAMLDLARLIAGRYEREQTIGPEARAEGITHDEGQRARAILRAITPEPAG